jgi:short-subunit dehydrogenase involved in D-alanine esterification of teichoic acids
MRLTDNTVLITGGGSGVGRGLAIALHRHGNRVVIAGRRTDAMRAVADAHPGIEWLPLDITSSESIHRLATRAQRNFPDLNVVVNNAGAMATEDVCAPDAVALRFQLRGSGIEVKEIVPPRVQTDMTGPTGGGSLEVDDFVAQVMTQWVAQPDAPEIVVDAARALRYAERDGTYEQQFAMVNSAGQKNYTATESEKS